MRATKKLLKLVPLPPTSILIHNISYVISPVIVISRKRFLFSQQLLSTYLNSQIPPIGGSPQATARALHSQGSHANAFPRCRCQAMRVSLYICSAMRGQPSKVCQGHSRFAKKSGYASRFCVSSLRRGHANLLCIVPILLYVLPKQVRPLNVGIVYLNQATTIQRPVEISQDV